MWIDCILFNDEFDILEKRLDLMSNIIDLTIVCEAPYTFTGKKKPLHFAKIQDRYPNTIACSVKKRHSKDPWINEANQRNACWEYIQQFDDEDVILINDVDEIPDPKLLYTLAYETGLDQPYVLFMQHFQGSEQCVLSDLWPGTCIVPAAYVKKIGPQKVREHIGLTKWTAINNAGWHYSWFGGVDRIIEKVEAYSHQEYNDDFFKDQERILTALQNGKPIIPEEYNQRKHTHWPNV